LADVAADVIIDAPVEAVWAAVVDWDRQSAWVLGTTVRATTNGGVGLGGGLEAYTGVGQPPSGDRGLLNVGFTDTMVITEWEPPHRCTVRHTGRVVRGEGVFEVFALPGGRSRFVWTERLDLPAGRHGHLGRLSRLGWPLAKPVLAAGARVSLRRLATLVEAEQRSRPNSGRG
jgi:uncharacterized protein YndB with AHSA1/START domain